jgi:EAL domain
MEQFPIEALWILRKPRRALKDFLGTYHGFGMWSARKYDGSAHFFARRLELDVRKALLAEEFELYYQPLINLQRNEIIACEALLRWRHLEKGLVSPAVYSRLGRNRFKPGAHGFVPCCEAARVGDYGVGAFAGQCNDSQDPARAQRAGRSDFHGRLRYGLFLLELPKFEKAHHGL